MTVYRTRDTRAGCFCGCRRSGPDAPVTEHELCAAGHGVLPKARVARCPCRLSMATNVTGIAGESVTPGPEVDEDLGANRCEPRRGGVGAFNGPRG